MPKGAYEHRRWVRRGNGKPMHDGSNTITLSLDAGEALHRGGAGISESFTLSIGPQ